MAVQGSLTEPFLLTSLEPDYYLPPIPQGTLEDGLPFLEAPPETVLPVTSAFFIPPAALGFMTDVDTLEVGFDALESFIFAGALVQEGSHTEPTEGQIWPR